MRSLAELPAARAYLFDLTPDQLLRLDGLSWPPRYRRRLDRYRYGPGVFKIDWALSAPIPWRAAACRRAGTVHLGGTLEEIAASERSPWNGREPERPLVLVGQARPVARLVPYATPDPRVFLCSASTPPSGGVHGMCGHLAARAVLRLEGPQPL